VNGDQAATGERAGEQRDHHIERHRQGQGLPRDDDIGDAHQQRDDRGESGDHDGIVHRDLHRGVRRVALGHL